MNRITTLKNITVFFLLLGTNCVFGSDNDDKLWYKQPAAKWIESLPVGNGRIGAVVFGGIEKDKLGLNVSTLWSGEPSNTNEKPTGSENLEKIRSLLFNGELAEAERLCGQHLIGNKDNFGTHLPLGNLLFNFSFENSDVKNYKRELDIQHAIASVQFKKGGVNFNREIFVSKPNKLIVVKLTSDKKKNLNAKLSFDALGLPVTTSKVADNIFGIEGDAFENIHSNGKVGVHFYTAVMVKKCDGTLSVTEKGIKIENASEVEIFISANTNYQNSNPEDLCLEQLNAIKDETYNEIKKRHIADYQELFSRVYLNLGNSKNVNTPTDERLSQQKEAGDDPELYALFYNYARYLFIACSREDSPLPANLQGIWNDNFACKMPWTCDFHLDINTQQNYWLAESGNLSECHKPLFKLVDGLVESGKRTAKVLYKQDGWVAHVFTNAWGYTAPGWGLGWGLHVTGGIWIGSHFWNHYEYTLDREFLQQRAYPVLKEAAIFFKGYLKSNQNSMRSCLMDEWIIKYYVNEVNTIRKALLFYRRPVLSVQGNSREHPENGMLVSGPSISPENKYFDENGNIFSETMGATCDAILIRDLFDYCIEASEILNVDEGLRKELIEKKAKLQPLTIGKHGQLQEWLKDYEDAVPNHRHTSHLISLFPSNQITPYGTPELAKAAKVSIERRLDQPDWEDVEWSRGNFINFYARLLDGEKALHHLKGLLTENTGISLLTYSRGGIASAQEDIFVIDGNFSGACGISEMLVQSYNDEIFILPALPKEWKEGEFKGVCTRNGFELNIEWKNRQIEKIEILSKKGKQCNINYQGKNKSFNTTRGKTYILDRILNSI